MRAALCLLAAGCSFRPGSAPIGDGNARDATADAAPVMPNYFVDYATGADTNDGRSIATPWQHAPGDAAATGAPAIAQLAPGDVVLFKGGIAYHGAIAIAASGSPTSPIVYTGADNGQWGTGVAIIDEQEARGTAFTLSARSYVRIDSFAITSFDKTAPIAIEVTGGQHVEISNNQISDVYYPTNPSGSSLAAWAQPLGIGVYVHNATAAYVHDNHIRDVGYAGILYRADGGDTANSGTLAHNNVTNMNNGIRLELDDLAGSQIANVAIVGNVIHDFDQYVPVGAWHRDGLDVASTASPSAGVIQHVEISNNYFTAVGATFAGSNGWIYVTGNATSFVVHHNIFNAPPAYFALRFDATPLVVTGNHVIASNVFSNTQPLGVGMHIDHTTGTQIANNIFFDSAEGYEIATSAMSGLSADYDLFDRLSGTDIARLNTGPASSPGGDLDTLAALQTAGFEAHALQADPMFATAQDLIDADPTGFTPMTSSMAIDHGTAAGFSLDFVGNAIPRGIAPDIGAFEVK